MSAHQLLGKVIAHVDLDAFYAQCEVLHDPERLKDRPVGVIQYNPYGDLKTLAPEDDRLMNDSNASLIAVNYAARAAGVKRNHRGNEARTLCPDLQLVQVPTKHGKADLTLYRNAGKQVLKILGQGNAVKIERASIDECYLDLTEEANNRLAASGGLPSAPVRPHQVHLYSSTGEDIDAETWWNREDQLWGPGERLIAQGAAIVAELREKVEATLGYTCSAGIAPTRLLAKLCSGLHKPAQQTVVPPSSVAALLSPLPLSKLRGLGGQFGRQVATDLYIETVGQLEAVPLNKLENVFGAKDGRWLFDLARGIDDAEVEERRVAKSVSCGKTFRGAYALTDIDAVHTWLLELAAELEERLLEDKEDNQRTPQLLTVSVGAGNESWGSGGNHFSRSCSIRKVEAAAMAADAAGLVKRWANEQPTGWRITDLFLGASSFVDVQTTSITKFFKPASAATTPVANAAVVVEGEGDGRDRKESKEVAVSGINKRKMIAPAVNSTSECFNEKKEHREGQRKDGGGVSASASCSGGVQYIDESVFAELPLEIQRELRAAMKFEEMQARAAAGQKQRAAANGGGGSSARERQQMNSKTNKRQVVDASQQTLKDLFRGKRPKNK